LSLAERPAHNRSARGSNPLGPTNYTGSYTTVVKGFSGLLVGRDRTAYVYLFDYFPKSKDQSENQSADSKGIDNLLSHRVLTSIRI
ncbi:MAG: hypothetical protein M3297_14420, partial [Thermoproteota archaeon]|nr:hypothetical protein [Thermoproteota archaeon]